MNTSLSKSIVAAALCVFILNANAALKAGDPLPDLSTFKLEGKVPDIKGKIVLLDFWASWCQPCHESFPVLDALQKKYGDRLVVIGVSVDDQKSKMKGFLEKQPVSFAVVRDAEQKLAATAEPPTMPSSFIIDSTGVVRFAHDGFHGNKTRDEYIKEIDSLLK